MPGSSRRLLKAASCKIGSFCLSTTQFSHPIFLIERKRRRTNAEEGLDDLLIVQLKFLAEVVFCNLLKDLDTTQFIQVGHGGINKRRRWVVSSLWLDSLNSKPVCRKGLESWNPVKWAQLIKEAIAKISYSRRRVGFREEERRSTNLRGSLHLRGKRDQSFQQPVGIWGEICCWSIHKVSGSNSWPTKSITQFQGREGNERRKVLNLNVPHSQGVIDVLGC